jgi:aspartate-semialdehyde dehydrogenase
LAEVIALVGGETLLGREVREVIGDSALAQNLRLVAAAEDETGTLTQIGGSAAFLAKLDTDALDDAEVLILAGTPESSKKALETNPDALIIDLTYVTEDDPEARIRAPQLESPDYDVDDTGPRIVAHPAALSIAMVLQRLNGSYPVARSIVHVFQPASEFGTAGIEELQQQTVNLLAFQPLPKKTFDAQVAYAMLPQLGTEAPAPLLDIEDRIERHLATLLERTEGVPMPSLRLVQAPVFHGYSLSFWVEFEESLSASEIEDALRHEAFDLRTSDTEPPNNVGIAGQSGIAVGAIAPDRNSSNAFWVWAAVDNLRLAAETAALIAGERF